MKAVTGSVSDQIVRWLELLWEPGQTAELRILGTQRAGTVSGYFDDPVKLAKAAALWNGKAEGVYWTLNPVDPALLARSANRLTERCKRGTDDKQVIRRRWLPIDFDPRRPAGTSASDAEKAPALDRCRACREWLSRRSWPDPILADSGNGYHLLYRVDLPNDKPAAEQLQHCLQALALRYEDAAVSIDTGNFNAARIWKLYGTKACKGDSIPERPHRLSRVLEFPL